MESCCRQLLGFRSKAHRGVGWRLCDVEVPRRSGSLLVSPVSEITARGTLHTGLLPSKQGDKYSGVLFSAASLICKLIIKRRLERRKESDQLLSFTFNCCACHFSTKH